MTVLFIKVDGCLNHPQTDAKAPDGSLGVVNSLVKQLRNDLKTNMEPGTQLVLYGDWAKDWNFDEEKCTPRGKYLIKKLDREGLHLMDHVNSDIPSETEQIKQYAESHHVDRYEVWRESQ